MGLQERTFAHAERENEMQSLTVWWWQYQSQYHKIRQASGDDHKDCWTDRFALSGMHDLK
jgi:hypothetical protein